MSTAIINLASDVDAAGRLDSDVLVWNSQTGKWTRRPSLVSVEVDFGATPVDSATFTIANAAITTASHIVAQIAYEAPTGKDLDEVEMDDIVLRCQPDTGQFFIFAHASDGSYLADKFHINYSIG